MRRGPVIGIKMWRNGEGLEADGAKRRERLKQTHGVRDGTRASRSEKDQRRRLIIVDVFHFQAGYFRAEKRRESYNGESGK